MMKEQTKNKQQKRRIIKVDDRKTRSTNAKEP